MDHIQSGHTACHNAERRLSYAATRLREAKRARESGDFDHADRLSAEAAAEINAAREYVAKAKTDINIALVDLERMQNAWLALSQGLGGRGQ